MNVRDKDIAMRSLYMLVCCGTMVCAGSSCTRQYVFEFRHAKSHKPIVNTPVVLSSLPPIYNWIDPRHYTHNTGRPVIADGLTDDAGTVVLRLPSNLSIKSVQLSDRWYARPPYSSWKPMLTRQEYVYKVDPTSESGRPLVRMKME